MGVLSGKQEGIGSCLVSPAGSLIFYPLTSFQKPRGPAECNMGAGPAHTSQNHTWYPDTHCPLNSSTPAWELADLMTGMKPWVSWNTQTWGRGILFFF